VLVVEEVGVVQFEHWIDIHSFVEEWVGEHLGIVVDSCFEEVVVVAFQVGVEVDNYPEAIVVVEEVAVGEVRVVAWVVVVDNYLDLVEEVVVVAFEELPILAVRVGGIPIRLKQIAIHHEVCQSKQQQEQLNQKPE